MAEARASLGGLAQVGDHIDVVSVEHDAVEAAPPGATLAGRPEVAAELEVVEETSCVLVGGFSGDKEEETAIGLIGVQVGERLGRVESIEIRLRRSRRHREEGIPWADGFQFRVLKGAPLASADLNPRKA